MAISDMVSLKENYKASCELNHTKYENSLLVYRHQNVATKLRIEQISKCFLQMISYL